MRIGISPSIAFYFRAQHLLPVDNECMGEIFVAEDTEKNDGQQRFLHLESSALFWAPNSGEMLRYCSMSRER